MINFPKGTLFNKRVAKQKLYQNLSVTSRLEQQFTKEIESIYWKNKLSSETLNISQGNYVTEIEIFEIRLKEKNIGKNIIELIDREIPYHIVFVLRYGDLGQVWISFKESGKNKEGQFKVDSYYKTNWLNYEQLTLAIEGLNLDKVYENFMLQIAGGKLRVDSGLSIKEAVAKAKEREKLEAEIKSLETKIKNEKQFNRQVKLMGKLRKAKAKLENSYK